MNKKIVVSLLATLILASVHLAEAQQAKKVPRIGFLGSGSASAYSGRIEAFREGLLNLGYVEGKNITIEYRWAEGKYDRLREFASELVRLKVDVIVTHGTPGARAAKQATTTIPIVIAVIGDAVATGLVESLARPGGNITGSSFFGPELYAKRLELLKEAIPGVTRVAGFLNQDNPANRLAFKAMELTAQSLGVEVHRVEVRGPNEFDSAFSGMTKRRVDALVIAQDAMLTAHVRRIAELAVKSRLPSSGFTDHAEAGGLMGYGVNDLDLWRRAAIFVDKILKGTKPTDLPVEQAMKFELIINLKTAKQIGVTIPPNVLARADKVIR